MWPEMPLIMGVCPATCGQSSTGFDTSLSGESGRRNDIVGKDVVGSDILRWMA